MDRSQIKGLFAGFIIHDPEVQLIILDPAVHPVHLASQTKLCSGFGDHHGGKGLPFSKAQLKGQGHKVRAAHLFGHLVDHGVGSGTKPGEQVAETGRLLLEILKLPGNIQVHVFADQLMKLPLPYFSKATPVQNLCSHMFQQVMEEGADLRGIEGGRSPWLCPQAVLHEIGKMAAAQTLRPGGGHGKPAAIKGLNGGGRKAPPLHGGSTTHGIQIGLIRPFFFKKLPKFSSWHCAGCLQRRLNSCQAVLLVISFFLDIDLRKKLFDPVHHKGRPQLRAGNICHRITKRQSFGRLCQSGIQGLKFDAHPLHAAGSQLHTKLRQLIPVIVGQNAAALSRIGDHMVVHSQEEQVFHSMPVISSDLTDGNLVQGYRDGTHTVLGQDLTEQTGKLLQIHGLTAQNLHELVQYAAKDIPQLRCLLRHLQTPCLSLGVHLGFQGRSKAQPLHEGVKLFHFLPCGFRSLHAVCKRRQQFPHPAAKIIHPG